MNGGEFPFITSVEYMRTLIDHYCVQFSSQGGQLKRVLLVGGPKDLGKSTGLFYTKIAAEDIKFNTFSIDLIKSLILQK